MPVVADEDPLAADVVGGRQSGAQGLIRHLLVKMAPCHALGQRREDSLPGEGEQLQLPCP